LEKLLYQHAAIYGIDELHFFAFFFFVTSLFCILVVSFSTLVCLFFNYKNPSNVHAPGILLLPKGMHVKLKHSDKEGILQLDYILFTLEFFCMHRTMEATTIMPQIEMLRALK
jgi:hypothetical protein